MITVDPAKLAKLNAEKRIAELKQLLRDSDFKVLPDYKDRAGMTDAKYAEIVVNRKNWYDELKSLEIYL
jgi:hypothetical protein